MASMLGSAASRTRPTSGQASRTALLLVLLFALCPFAMLTARSKLLELSSFCDQKVKRTTCRFLNNGRGVEEADMKTTEFHNSNL